MATQTVTLELSESVYRSAIHVAQVTQRPLADILQKGIEHTLPPLDDLSSEEANELARLSVLTDTELWRISEALLPIAEQRELENLLENQRERDLSYEEQFRLQALMDQYGQLLVQKAHVWLLGPPRLSCTNASKLSLYLRVSLIESSTLHC